MIMVCPAISGVYFGFDSLDTIHLLFRFAADKLIRKNRIWNCNALVLSLRPRKSESEKPTSQNYQDKTDIKHEGVIPVNHFVAELDLFYVSALPVLLVLWAIRITLNHMVIQLIEIAKHNEI